jgi:spore coat polysaccharide biosynthesis protein SpsF
MKTGILITARLGSTRLKQKHMLRVCGKPIIYYLIERIRRGFLPQLREGKVEIVIATSDEPENRAFDSLQMEDLKVFYGSVRNIPLRQFQAVDCYGLDYAISIDGDDVLCSIAAMHAVREALHAGKDFVRTSGLPFGMNVMGYSRSFLESSINAHMSDILETGWGRIFDASLLKTIDMGLTEDEKLRFTLDYDEDYQFLSRIIELMGDDIFTAKDTEVLKLVDENNLWQINEKVCKEYWYNFYKKQNQESEQGMSLEKSGDRS